MDELERELRRVLHDDRLRVDPAPDALDRVHRGATRLRRRRRAAAGGLSVVSVAAVATLALATPVLDRNDGEGTTAAGPSTTSEKAQSSTAKPSALESGRRSSPDPQRRTGGPVPARFAASSVTALSPNSFWVLGTAPCSTDVCTSVVHTSDGGKTFRGLPAPKAPLAKTRATGRSVTDLRFAGVDDGFAFGGALWSTHDGGRSWAAQDLPGRVVRLETDRSTAWAVVQAGDGFRLYRSPASTDDWRRVSLPTTLAAETPGLALLAGSVTLTGTSGDRAVSLVSTDGGRSFTTRDRPCASGLSSALSAFGDTLWMFCATGTQGRPYVSSNAGLSWRAVDAAPPGGWANATTVGARGAKSAVLGSGDRLYRVSAGGAVRQTATAPGGRAFGYVGFTTPSVGYAVADSPGRTALLRTTDGGRSWSVVRYS